MRVLSSAALAVAVLALTGCGGGKINEKKTWNMKEANARAADIPAQSKAYKLNVKYSSSDGEVGVFVFKSADVKNDDALETVEASKAIAKTRGKDGTLTADVPENPAVRVVVREAAKQPDVTVEITN